MGRYGNRARPVTGAIECDGTQNRDWRFLLSNKCPATDQFEAGATSVIADPQADGTLRLMIENIQKRANMLRTLIEDEIERDSDSQ
jgi:hypothetical protein